MTVLFYLLIALLFVLFLTAGFVNASPVRIAAWIRLVGPAILAVTGLVLTLSGRVGVGIGLLGIATTWFLKTRKNAGISTAGPRRSYVRSAALEMQLDHDTGEMNGLVLAGQYEGQDLDSLDKHDLIVLMSELMSDAESCQLLEAYLDRRMPDWRMDPQANPSDGARQTQSTGTMTEQEAYEILGLGAGAGEADIRDAHRRLMKRVHPDTGGSVFLAARINEAKDILLRRHG